MNNYVTGGWIRIWLKRKGEDFSPIIVLICPKCDGIGKSEYYDNTLKFNNSKYNTNSQMFECIYCCGVGIEPIPMSEILSKDNWEEIANEYSRKRL